MFLTRGVLWGQRCQRGAPAGAVPHSRARHCACEHTAQLCRARRLPPCHMPATPDVLLTSLRVVTQGRVRELRVPAWCSPHAQETLWCATTVHADPGAVARVGRGIHPPFPLLGHLAMISKALQAEFIAEDPPGSCRLGGSS